MCFTVHNLYSLVYFFIYFFSELNRKDPELLSHSCMFQVEICSQQLEICKSVCMFIVLALLWRLINFRLFCSDDCRSWPCDEKINNHGCWGKYAHIPVRIIAPQKKWFTRHETDRFLNNHCQECVHAYLSIHDCLSFHHHGIYFYLHPTFFSSTEQCTWPIISTKEFKSWVTRISFALLYGTTELSAIKYFAICS
jgi:hypothetical protein